MWISEKNKMPTCLWSINREVYLRLESKAKRSDFHDPTFKGKGHSGGSEVIPHCNFDLHFSNN